jgi:hypothetical protein
VLKSTDTPSWEDQRLWLSIQKLTANKATARGGGGGGSGSRTGNGRRTLPNRDTVLLSVRGAEQASCPTRSCNAHAPTRPAM